MVNYSYRLTIKGNIYYYADGVILDKAAIPLAEKPSISRSDLTKAALRKKLSSGKVKKEESPDPPFESPKTDAESHKDVYYTVVDDVKSYMYAEMVAGKKVLIKLDLSQLSKFEIENAKPASEFFTATAPAPTSSSPLKPKPKSPIASTTTRRPRGGVKKIRAIYYEQYRDIQTYYLETKVGASIFLVQIDISKLTLAEITNMKPASVFYARTNEHNMHWKAAADAQMKKMEAEEHLRKEQELRKKEDEARRQQEAFRRQQEVLRKKQEDDARRQEEQQRKNDEYWRQFREKNSQRAGYTRIDVQQRLSPRSLCIATITPFKRVEMQALLVKYNISNRKEWRLWALKHHPDRNPGANISLLQQINEAADIVFRYS